MTTFRYVFAEASLGLRRNLSMAISLVVTIFVSLTLVGLGLLVNAQAHRTEESLGSQLTIQALLCNQLSVATTCSKADVSAAQKDAIVGVLKTNGEVKAFTYQSKQQAYELFRKYFINPGDAASYQAVRPSDMREAYTITLKDPRQYRDVESQLEGMPGVDSVHDLHNQLGALYTVLDYLKWGSIGIAVLLLVAAIFQVVNTIRLATMARRREIGIMRLVGASSLYISLPFLMEILVAATAGVLLAAAAVAAFMQFVMYDRVRNHSHIMAWVDWSDFSSAVVRVAALGLILTMIPTLFVTRRYLKV